jgi:osmotically-inducible protein OsmY
MRHRHTLPFILVVGSFAVAACVSSPPRSPEEQAEDAYTAAQVEAALTADQRIYARHIDVRVDRGAVHLGGFVWSSEELLFAKNDAAAIPGVTGVADEMELLRGGVSGTSR